MPCRHWTVWLEFPLIVALIVALIGWMGWPFTPRTTCLHVDPLLGAGASGCCCVIGQQQLPTLHYHPC